MKQFFALFFLTLLNMNLLIKAQEKSWQDLPKEMKQIILSQIPEGASFDDALSAMQTLRGISRETRDITRESIFMDQFTKEYVKKNKKQAEEELLWASRSANTSNQHLIRNLIRGGLDLNISDEQGKTALNISILSGDLAFVQLLIDGRARVNKPNDDSYIGDTPLITAIKQRDPKMINLLLKAGANINQMNIEGDTPLMMATRYNNPEMVDLLLKAGADVAIKSSKEPWPTALNLANREGFYQVAEILKGKPYKSHITTYVI